MLRLGREIYKKILKHLIVSESKKVLQKIIINGAQELPMAKAERI